INNQNSKSSIFESLSKYNREINSQFFEKNNPTTHLKNEISRFTQRFEETFREAWERFKKILRACPHHGFSELTQIDTFYNGFNEQDQDSLNAVTGENLLIEEACVICGGAHPYYDCIAIDSNISSACVTTGSGSLPSNTVDNLRGNLKAITTRSSVSYDGPPICPHTSSLPKVVERVPEVTKDTVQPSIENIQPPVAQTQVPIDEVVVALKPKPTIPYPSRV
nr:reverse transcriptase domain-containing protein [Tanacetum cinerariifolium]